MAARRLRIGLVASRLHRHGPGAALFRLLAPLEASVRDELGPEFLIVGQTFDALAEAWVRGCERRASGPSSNS